MADNRNPMMNIMYRDMLFNLSAGVLMPQDREILSSRPLPPDFVDPYTSKQCDTLDAMQLTCNMMNVWIEETKTCDYFSQHFIDLSKEIFKGVTTLGRGLMTLHLRNEDISKAPMSIDDLIMVASYQLRKSYLGAIQTMKKLPESSMRLMSNQINWTNMLFRLYKTKEKLAVGSRQLAVVDEAASKVDGFQLPVASDEEAGSGQLPAASVDELSALDAFSEPSAIGGVRALRPLAGSGSEKKDKKPFASGGILGRDSGTNNNYPENGELSLHDDRKEDDSFDQNDFLNQAQPRREEIKSAHRFDEYAEDTFDNDSADIQKLKSMIEDEESQEIALTAEQMVALLQDEEFCQQNPDLVLQMQQMLILRYEELYGQTYEDVVDDLSKDPPPDRV